jgi:N-methylhydantoinase A
VGPEGGLRVGPRSAGASPGPMAYGRGGNQPTVTDAHLALGRLPDGLAGGSVPLSVDLARAGIERLASDLGLSLDVAAAGVLELSAHNQANAVLQLTVKRGIDPAGDTLVAFGGAGPLQAGRIAEILGLHTVLVPPSPGNVSAFGLLAVDLKDEYVVTQVVRQGDVDPGKVGEIFEGLEAQAVRSLSAEGVAGDRMSLLRAVDARYLGEAHEISIPLRPEFDAGSAAADFHDAHERIYGYAYRSGAHDNVVEFVNWKVTGLGLIERPRLEAPSPTGSGRPVGRRGGFHVYWREDLPAGFEAAGPAIIDEYGSTTVVERGFDFAVDDLANLVMRKNGRRDL